MTRRSDSHLSNGALALRKSGKTQSEIARLCGVSRQTVSRWWNGDKLPAPEQRARLEVLGLALAEQWIQGGASRKAAVRPVPVEDGPALPPGQLNTRGELVAQATRLRALLSQDLTASAAIQVERALSQTLGAVARLDGVQITETTIVRHPAHRRVMAVIFSALEPYPDAARAVADALKAAGG